MEITKSRLGLLAIVLAVLTAPGAYAQSRAIDGSKSSLKIRVLKSGLFSGFAHDHDIEAPIEEGKIDTSANPSVQLRVDAGKMRVLDPGTSPGDLAEIQATMEGATVLDAAHFPEIAYTSTSVTKTGDTGWEVHGDLTLHGKKGPVDVAVSLQDGHYRGTALLKQSSFGIVPIKIAGGTVKVKDEVKIEFDIVAVQ